MRAVISGLYDRFAVRQLSRYELWYGRDEPPVDTREFRAGRLSVQLHGIDLRYAIVDGVEVMRRLFVAVHDAAWATIPPRVSGIGVEEGDGSFQVTFEVAHEAGDLRYCWRGTLAGEADGVLECTMQGFADSDFDFNRIGFCILHPSAEAGRRYRARTADGEVEGSLPQQVGQQQPKGGVVHPLFPAYDRLEIEVAEGLWVRFEFEGDLFEMEDQRNWTDASFKTYSTHLGLGWPHHAAVGDQIVQRVRLSIAGAVARSRRRPARACAVELGSPRRELLPPFGLCVASHGEPLTQREEELIVALRPNHLRADLDLGGAWRDELERASEQALSTAGALELALWLGDNPEQELEALGEALPLAQARVSRFLVFRRSEIVSDARWARLARSALAACAPAAAYACGTDWWFAELNRTRPSVDGADAVAYSIAATVRADDDASVIETPAGQGDTVRSARAVFDGADVVVSPVTIRPRSWQLGEPAGSAPLPYQVDPRQCALFGAAWTVASAKHLLEADVASVTYFETTGWRGVLERESGAPDPEHFLSEPGHVFPLYHVLADLGDWRHAVLVPCTSSEPLCVEALGVRTEMGPHVLVANLTSAAQRCTVGPLETEPAAIRVLDEETAAAAGEDPEAFRAAREPRDPIDGALELELAPYAVVRIDP